MPCYRPLEAWRTSERTSSGKNAIVFKKSGKHMELPIQLPCGQCIGCRADRASQWAMRCTQEAQLHEKNCFITLTYSDEHLPWDGSLIKSHPQKFLKKLRKHLSSSQTLRYYMAGEYGEKLSRPHYHLCLFGIDFHDKEVFHEQEGILTYTSETLSNLWGKGFCTLGELNFETAAYTARYIQKKITGDKADDHYTITHPLTGEIIKLEPEYNAMSLKPAVAKEWYEKYKSDVYPSDYLIRKGYKTSVPRYFDKLLERENPHDLETIKKARKKNARRFEHDNTPERLATREKVKTLNAQQISRGYENGTSDL